MKVIDLLNKIANGEEVPKKIKFDDDNIIFEYNGDYFNSKNGVFLEEYCHLTTSLNDEVVIIEEDKKITKLDFIEENTFSKRQNGMTSEDRRLLDSNFRELGNKINEIIDCLKENK